MSYSVLKNSHLVTVHKKIHYSRNIYMYLLSVTQLQIQYCIAEYSYMELYFLTTKARKCMYVCMYIYIVRHSYYTKYLIYCVGNVI